MMTDSHLEKKVELRLNISVTIPSLTQNYDYQLSIDVLNIANLKSCSWEIIKTWKDFIKLDSLLRFLKAEEMKSIKEPFLRKNQNKNLTINNAKRPQLPRFTKRFTPQQEAQIDTHRTFLESYLTQIMTLDLISEVDELKEFFGLFRIQKRELMDIEREKEMNEEEMSNVILSLHSGSYLLDEIEANADKILVNSLAHKIDDLSKLKIELQEQLQSSSSSSSSEGGGMKSPRGIPIYAIKSRIIECENVIAQLKVKLHLWRSMMMTEMKDRSVFERVHAIDAELASLNQPVSTILNDSNNNNGGGGDDDGGEGFICWENKIPTASLSKRSFIGNNKSSSLLCIDVDESIDVTDEDIFEMDLSDFSNVSLISDIADESPRGDDRSSDVSQADHTSISIIEKIDIADNLNDNNNSGIDSNVINNNNNNEDRCDHEIDHNNGDIEEAEDTQANNNINNDDEEHTNTPKEEEIVIKRKLTSNENRVLRFSMILRQQRHLIFRNSVRLSKRLEEDMKELQNTIRSEDNNTEQRSNHE